MQVSGAPAAGDEFVVREATSTDLFSSLDALADTLESTPLSQAERAQFRQEVRGHKPSFALPRAPTRRLASAPCNAVINV